MTRTIGWNGLQLTIPSKCDDIVSGNRHLVVEQNFQPIVELRWEIPEGRKLPATIRSVIRQIQKASPEPCSEVPPPPELMDFTRQKGVHCLQTGESGLSLIWLCTTCQTLLLCRLYSNHNVSLSDIAGILFSIKCHQHQNQANLWQVQDFRLELPSRYQLSSFRFQAGLSRLLFNYKEGRLLVCRMAPASERLLHTGLADLLCSLHEHLSLQQVEYVNENHVQCATDPSLAGQILLRLKRQKAFCRGLLRHDILNNRILALLAESNKPIAPDPLNSLFSQYEIIPS